MAKAKVEEKVKKKAKSAKPDVKSKASAKTQKSKSKPEQKKKSAKPEKVIKSKVKVKEEPKTKKGAPKEGLIKQKPTEIPWSVNKKTAKKVGDWDIKHLRAAAYNPRYISPKELANLEKAMVEFGDLSGIVLNRRSGNLVSGHQRTKTISKYKSKIVTKAASDDCGTIEEGYVQYTTGREGKNKAIRVPYRVVDWDARTEMAANIAANAHGGSFDMKKLAMMTSALEVLDNGVSIELLGLDLTMVKSMQSLIAPPPMKEGSNSSEKAFPEYGAETYQNAFKHSCPRCAFRFNDANDTEENPKESFKTNPKKKNKKK